MQQEQQEQLRTAQPMQLVALAKCLNYTQPSKIESKIVALMDTVAGEQGLSALIHPGMRVAIKLNLVSALKPERAATIHPEVARAVARAVKTAGGTPFFIESPGGPTTRQYVSRVYNVTGIQRVAEDECVEIEYDLQTTTVPLPGGRSMKRVDILKNLVNADFVINICKPKGHGFMRYTGAVKNMFGAIAGLEKAEHHVRRSNHQQFADGIIDIYNAVNPDISICDGVYGMHKRGPTSGEPFNTGFLAASTNAYALDRVIVELLKADYKSIPICAKAVEYGYMPADVREIQVVDPTNTSATETQDVTEVLQRYSVNGFILPTVQMEDEVGVMGGFVNKLAIKFFRQKPVFHKNKCIRCGMCVKSCPAKCLVLEKGMQKPRPDLKKCIRCFCCEELCVSKAVDIKRGLS